MQWSAIFISQVRVLTLDKIHAKAVLERDLGLLRARRAERERELGAARLRESSRTSPTNIANAIPHTSTDLPDFDLGDMMGIQGDDIKTEPMLNGDFSAATTTNVKTEASAQNTMLNGAKGQDPKLLKEPKSKVEAVDTDLDSSFAHIPDDADFDSMFVDANVNAGDDFDFDFSTDMHTSSDLLGPNPLGDLTSSSDSFANISAPASGEDINTLLPGLESYVNPDGDGGDDFAMVEIPGDDSAFSNTMTSNPQNKATSSGPGAISQDSGLMNIDTDMYFGTDGAMDNFEVDDWLKDL